MERKKLGEIPIEDAEKSQQKFAENDFFLLDLLAEIIVEHVMQSTDDDNKNKPQTQLGRDSINTGCQMD